MAPTCRRWRRSHEPRERFPPCCCLKVTSMRYNQLGQTGLFVSELCLGTMTFGGGERGHVGQHRPTRQQDRGRHARPHGFDRGRRQLPRHRRRLCRAAAPRRSPARPSRNLGLKRDEIVARHQGPRPDRRGSPMRRGASRYHLIDALQGQPQAPPARPYRPLPDPRRRSRRPPSRRPCARSTRSSSTATSATSACRTGPHGRSPRRWASSEAARARPASRASLQAYYTLAGRDLERDIVPMLTSEQVGLMVWSPLAGRFLSRANTRRDAERRGAGRRRAAFDFPPVDKDRGAGGDRRDDVRSPRPTPSRSRGSRWPGCCTSGRSPASSSGPNGRSN